MLPCGCSDRRNNNGYIMSEEDQEEKCERYQAALSRIFNRCTGEARAIALEALEDEPEE